MKKAILAFCALLGAGGAAQAQALSLDAAIRRAIGTHPAIGEATSNRRATEFELRQSQGALLPQVRLQADIGPERRRLFDTNLVNPGGAEFVNGRQANVTVRQVLFDGFATVNEVWRQVARVDASSWRVQERSELVALDTVQAYTDILRLRSMIGHADQNVAAHRGLLSDVEARFSGGRAGRGDRDQALERVRAAEAARAELRQRLGEAVALFRRAVGAEPVKLSWPGRPVGLPRSQREALQLAMRSNPTLRAAGADLDAAEAQKESAKGANYPTVAVEGRAMRGKDTQNNTGRFDDLSVKLSASWSIYTGGTDAARQSELTERVGEQQMKVAALRRQSIESIDKAWTTRAALTERIRALEGQVSAAQRVVSAYRSEYQLGQRTLLDLLNSEQTLYNARVGLINAKGLAIFADYQLLATSGVLLSSLKVPAPLEASTPLRGLKGSGAFLPPIDLVPRTPQGADATRFGP